MVSSSKQEISSERIGEGIELQLEEAEPSKVSITEEDIINEITIQANAAGIPASTAIRIARCESSLNPRAKNNTSSATGLYQFTIGTWEYIGSTGERTDFKESITQFVKWYPIYPGWWVCK